MTARIAAWLSHGDNAFGVMVICCAPLLAVCVIGMAGSGA